MKKRTENLTHSLDLRVKSHETLASIKDRKLYEAPFFFSAKGRFTLLLTPQIYSLFMRSVKKKQSAIVKGICLLSRFVTYNEVKERERSGSGRVRHFTGALHATRLKPPRFRSAASIASFTEGLNGMIAFTACG